MCCQEEKPLVKECREVWGIRGKETIAKGTHGVAVGGSWWKEDESDESRSKRSPNVLLFQGHGQKLDRQNVGNDGDWVISAEDRQVVLDVLYEPVRSIDASIVSASESAFPIFFAKGLRVAAGSLRFARREYPITPFCLIEISVYGD